MITFVRAIENFEVPALIGMPAGILVFATEVYLATKSVPTDFGLASTFAVVYLLITTGGVLLYLKWTAASEQFATTTGKGFRPAAYGLGQWRAPLAWLNLLLCFAEHLGIFLRRFDAVIGIDHQAALFPGALLEPALALLGRQFVEHRQRLLHRRRTGRHRQPSE